MLLLTCFATYSYIYTYYTTTVNRQGSYDEVMSVLPAVERPVLVTFFRPDSANTVNSGVFIGLSYVESILKRGLLVCVSCCMLHYTLVYN
jgi:hypothetical protein